MLKKFLTILDFQDSTARTDSIALWTNSPQKSEKISIAILLEEIKSVVIEKIDLDLRNLSVLKAIWH